MSRKLLIVSHAFPPNPGIGGRRWAKFAKYLSRKGFQIQVLASENVSGVQSEWNEDIKGITVKYLPYKFPKIVSYPGRALFDRIYYRLMLYLLKLTDNGNYFDRTVFWKNQVQNEISYFIEKEQYDCVIVTAGPFKLSHYIAELKKKYPAVKFIVDFRDLWTEDFEITSFSGLSFHRKLKEKKIEKETVHYADKVITVAPKLNDYFGSLTVKNKTEVIPNGFDPEDFKDCPDQDELKGSDMIRFVFTGTLYINLDYILKPFFGGLAELRKNNPDLYQKIRIEFIGNFPGTYMKYITENKLDIVTVTSKLPLNEVYRKIKESSYCLLFLNDVYNFALSTKFCEYISQKRKIVVVSNYGPAAKFIQKNKLGFWIDPSRSCDELQKLIGSSLHGDSLKWDTTFDINEFSLGALTDKLIRIIESDDYPKTCTVKQKNLLLTFDYELYLGSLSGTVENCLIRPTAEILSILKEVGIRHAIFFVDTSYLIKLKSNENCREDYRKLNAQLVGILKDGHFIFPHIHPHWSDAVYDERRNQWILNDLSKYRFHNIGYNDQVFYFEESIRLIKELQAAAGVSYAIDSYRAGGWCLQPFDKFRPFFEKHGIRYDFSVLKGFRKITSDVYYDYTKVTPKPIYKFSEMVDVEDKNGGFVELSISSINISNQSSFLNKIFNKYLWVTKNRSMGDGVSIKQTEEAFIREIEMQQHKEHVQNIEMASVELLTFYKMKIYRDFLDQNDYLHIISHPKMLSRHNVGMFRKFLKYARSNYEINTNYKTMTV